MKLAARVAKSMNASRKFAKVSRGPGDLLVVEFEYDAPTWFLVHSYVKLEGECEN